MPGGATLREGIRTSSLGFHPEPQRDEVLKQGTRTPSRFGVEKASKANRRRPSSHLIRGHEELLATDQTQTKHN